MNRLFVLTAEFSRGCEARVEVSDDFDGSVDDNRDWPNRRYGIYHQGQSAYTVGPKSKRRCSVFERKTAGR